MLYAVGGLAAAGLVGGARPVAASTRRSWTPRPETYGVAVRKDVEITMSDGVVLVADVLRPAGPDGRPTPGHFPVVLTQTPYNKNIPELNFRADQLVRRGYAQVIADVRGTGGSGGRWSAFGAREQRDGYELALWCARRSWSDGRLALHGASYGAINQLLTAAERPPGLRATFPVVPMGDAYRDVVGSGGQIDTGFVPLWLGLVTGAGLLPPSYLGKDPIQAATALMDHAGGAAGFQTSLALNALGGGDLAYDGPFYRSRSPLTVIDRVNVPTFVVGGWFDLFQRSEPILYRRLAARGVPARLLVGPWYHLTATMGQGLPADGVPTLDALELRWFDHYVRGVPDPALDRDIAPVTYFELGQSHYHRSPSWPPPGVRYDALQLTGPAAVGRPGRLRRGDPRSSVPDFLPSAPVSGICSRSTAQWTAGVAGETPCADDNRLNDITGLSYDLPAAGPLRLAGPLAAHLVVSTIAKDAQLTVRVEDVSPDGTVSQLTAGWQVLSLRALDRSRSLVRDGYVVRPWHPYTRRSVLPVPAGTPVTVDVEVFPTAAEIAPGHRLRLTLQTADFPHLTPPLPQALRSIGPGLRVWHDPDHPSYLVVPLVAG